MILGAKDILFGIRGTYCYYSCINCSSLWVNPRPADEEIPGLYMNYYTHSKPKSLLVNDKHSAKKSIRSASVLLSLRTYWGYEHLGQNLQSGLKGFLCWLLSVSPGSRSRSGELVKFVPFKKAGRLLDVGCGSGDYLLSMKELGWNCVGLEPDPNAVKSGIQAGLDIREGLPSEITVMNEKWDAITMSHVIEHVQSPPKALEDLCSALQDDGRLVSISPNPESTLAKIFKNHWIHLHPPHHLVIPSVRGYKLMAQSLNMKYKIFTSNRYATGSFRNSIANRIHGSVEGSKYWRVGKLWRVIFANILKLFSPYSGDEIICILRRY